MAFTSLRGMLDLEMIELVTARLHVLVFSEGGEDTRYTIPDEAIVLLSHTMIKVVRLFDSNNKVLCQCDTFNADSFLQ